MSSLSIPPVAAIDLGHSAGKVALIKNEQISTYTFVTAARPAKAISDETEARRAAADTVMVGRTPYWVADTAIAQRSDTIGLSDDWVSSEIHAALLLYAEKWIQGQGVDLNSGIPLLVMGLPSKLYGEQKKHLEAEVKKYLPNCRLKVVPQPNGPYYDIMFQSSGRPATSHSFMDESWAVVDVGYHTTDMMMMKAGGRFVGDAADSCAGMSVAADHLLRVLQEKHDLHKLKVSEMERVMQVGAVKYNGAIHQVGEEVGEAKNILITAITDKVQQLFHENAHSLDGILVAGGGASLVYQRLKEDWPHAHLVEDSRLAVARGFAKYGAMSEFQRVISSLPRPAVVAAA